MKTVEGEMTVNKLKFMILASAMVVTMSCQSRRDQESAPKTYGYDNSEGVISFETHLKVLRGPQDSKTYSSDTEFSRIYSSKINKEMLWQIQHIFSSLTNQGKYKSYPGVIGQLHLSEAEYKPEVIGTSLVDNGTAVVVNYRFRDKIALHNKHFDRDTAKISFVLPEEVTQIYKKGFPPNGGKNKCTDHHYDTEDDFWYFWDPSMKNCPIKKSDLVQIDAVVKKVPQRPKTYPEFAKLNGDNGNDKKLKVVLIYGIDESFESGDVGRTAYQSFLSLAKKQGYVMTGHMNKHKVLKLPKRTDVAVELHVYLLDPDEDKDFVDVVKSSLNGHGNPSEAADIFVYSGHSGLGGYLAPEQFGKRFGSKIELLKDKYQILAFQGCSSYAYYNHSYFDLKRTENDPKGTKNLDIITAGIGIAFGVSPLQEFKIIDNLVGGRKLSWQNIIDDVYLVDPENTALHQVNGDEDNPTTP